MREKEINTITLCRTGKQEFAMKDIMTKYDNTNYVGLVESLKRHVGNNTKKI